MSDLFSITCGVTGLVSLALQVGGPAVAYSNAVADAPEDITALVGELSLLGATLEQLG
jgi:hypothetical protein